jgi:hypothetical protein
VCVVCGCVCVCVCVCVCGCVCVLLVCLWVLGSFRVELFTVQLQSTVQGVSAKSRVGSDIRES